MAIAPSHETLPPHAVHCMEIWGGNEASHRAISVSGIDAWVYSQPSAGHASGGDVHYVSLCGGGKIARFALMDVAGHGASVSALATQLRGLMRKHINRLNQAGFAAALNREFSALSGGSDFATAVLTSYFAPTDHLIVLNAGHPPPLWYRADQGVWQFLDPGAAADVPRLGNIPLGIIEPTTYEQFAVKLGVGDLVLLYSDAFTESADVDGTLLGTAGLLDLVRRFDPRQPALVIQSVLSELTTRQGGRPVEDDATLILLHHNATDPPGLSFTEAIRVVAKMLGLLKV